MVDPEEFIEKLKESLGVFSGDKEPEGQKAQAQQPSAPAGSNATGRNTTGLKHITELEARIIFVLRKFGPLTLSEIKNFWDNHGYKEARQHYHRALKRLLEHGVVTYDGFRYSFNEGIYDAIKTLQVTHMREETKKAFGYE